MTQDISLERLLSKISSASSRDCTIEGKTITIKRILGDSYEVLFRQYTLLTNETGVMIQVIDVEHYRYPPLVLVEFIGVNSSTSDHEKMRREYNMLKERTEEDAKKRYEEYREGKKSIDKLKGLLDQ
ncbi:hypothetical protein J4208_04030 [Candidatus Woesearchaeota archaeon]|nr:hypothetical protein [Candidatus Woesearchaeota archaeon]